LEIRRDGKPEATELRHLKKFGDAVFAQPT
jgi:hypothetical protein